MTTAENISFTPSLYFRYTYTILTLYEHRRKVGELAQPSM